LKKGAGDKLRILLLTQWFDPEPTSKGLLFAKKLHEVGHSVEVLTGFPNYPGGKMYPGYRQNWRTRQTMDGIVVTRVPLYPSHDRSAIKRILNYLSFAVTSCLYGIFLTRKADVIYVYHPPMTVGLSAALISFFRRSPFVYDVQDLWPDTLRSTGMVQNQLVLRSVGLLCRWIYRRARHIVVLSPGFRDALIQRGVDEKAITVIHNWCDEAAVQAPDKCPLDLAFMDGRFNVVFAGNMGKAQALGAVIEAARLVASLDSQIQFVFVGGGLEVDDLKKMSASTNLTNVRFLPPVPMKQVGQILSRASALLVHLKDDPLFPITIPSKTQAYLAAGKPILMGVRGNAADLVQAAGAGVFVEPENSASIANGVLQIARLPLDAQTRMGENGYNFYSRELSLDTGVRKFLKVFSQTQSADSR